MRKNPRRKLVGEIIILVCIASLILAGNAPAGSQLAEINDPDGYTFVRSAKSKESNVVARIETGEHFQAEPAGDDWWLVTTANGKSGYMHRSRIHLINAPDPETTSRLAVINDPDGYTFVRSAKTTGSTPVARLETGTRFLVETSAGKWWRVTTMDGKSGYMHRSRIQMLDSNDPLPASPKNPQPRGDSDVLSPDLYNVGFPVLEIEPGAHSDAVKSHSVDAAGKLLLTASTDKTARLWDLESGRLLRTFRVPIGPGFQGKLYAAALSPDGSLAAVGGYTGGGENGIYTIYQS